MTTMLRTPRTPVKPLPNLDEHKEEKSNVVEEEYDEEEVESHHEVAERFTCLSLHHKRDFINKGEKLYGEWKQEQKLRESIMEFHLSEGWALDKLIEEQLSRFDAHYSRSMVQCKPKDVTQLLIPKGRLPLEMTTLAWLGNWRPSAILSLLHSISRSSVSGSLSLDKRGKRLLSQLIHETRIEETVLDEEMAEIQATCILHLPFSPTNNISIKSSSNMACVHSEFKKIHRVITQAQKLRYRTLELVVKKLLSRAQAAEFLVAFARIQDIVHEGKRLLSQLIHETRIEETVLDEEMAEIQATCILHLPFSPTNNISIKSSSNMACVHSEFKKIHRVITQAQKLRYRTLELVVKKLLSRAQAAEFLVAFARIQDIVHEYAACQMRQKGPISVTIKPLEYNR
ncbi:seed dormancy control protein [Thalictrum thalictroides]|uniref:Seed dormancy control protein n=1 Tax=Thalictrum thalictroides TaxID=46969 RepID=A0A7J6X8L4_THATH|nr:seed dormancy control protein [Thalictrum thalictroides]